MSDSVREPGFDPVILYKGLFLGAVAVFVATPLIATALGGLKSLGELRSNPFGLPSVWEWSNYADILFSQRYWQLLFNSVVIATLTVALSLIVSSMAAFVFAHIRFFGRDMLLSYLTLGLLFPPRPPSCRSSSRFATSDCSTATWASCCRRSPSRWR